MEWECPLPLWLKRELSTIPCSPILVHLLIYAVVMHGIRDGLLVIFLWYSMVGITYGHINVYLEITKALSFNIPVYCPSDHENLRTWFEDQNRHKYDQAILAADKFLCMTLLLMFQAEFWHPMSFRNCLYGGVSFVIVTDLALSAVPLQRKLYVNLGFWRDYWITVRKQEEAAAKGKAQKLSSHPQWRSKLPNELVTRPVIELPVHLGLGQHPYFGGSPAHKPPVRKQPPHDQAKPKKCARKNARPDSSTRRDQAEAGWDFLRR